MNDYDSILKEKKRISPESTNQSKKHFPTFTLSLIATILILIISYVIYYNTILAKDKIIINNVYILKEKYQNIIGNLYIDKILNNNLEGNILIDKTTTYNFIKDEENFYFKTPSLNKYINNSYEQKFNLNIEKTLSNIAKDKYIKTFYLNGKIPTVETNLVLSRPDLENMFGISFLNEYEAIITCQNHALTNEIITLKIVITNKITSDRKVITMENNKIYYKDSNNDLRFDISIKNNDFSIKIYKNDILNSVITGIEKVSTYNYSYQIIDKLYTLNLITRIEEEQYVYEFSSSIEGEKRTATLTLSNISNDLPELVNYTELSIEDKKIYNQEKNSLLEFINKYKNNI